MNMNKETMRTETGVQTEMVDNDQTNYDSILEKMEHEQSELVGAVNSLTDDIAVLKQSDEGDILHPDENEELDARQIAATLPLTEDLLQYTLLDVNPAKKHDLTPSFSEIMKETGLGKLIGKRPVTQESAEKMLNVEIERLIAKAAERKLENEIRLVGVAKDVKDKLITSENNTTDFMARLSEAVQSSSNREVESLMDLGTSDVSDVEMETYID